MAIDMAAVQRALQNLRAANQFDPSLLTQASSAAGDVNFQYNDMLNQQLKQGAGLDINTAQLMQRAQNQAGSQLHDMSRQYGKDVIHSTDDFANRGMAYSGAHIQNQSDLAGGYVGAVGKLQNDTGSYLDNLLQNSLNQKLQFEQQQQAELMKKSQTDQQYALAQAQTQAYINSMQQQAQAQAAPPVTPQAPTASPSPAPLPPAPAPQQPELPGAINRRRQNSGTYWSPEQRAAWQSSHPTQQSGI